MNLGGKFEDNPSSMSVFKYTRTKSGSMTYLVDFVDAKGPGSIYPR